MTTEAQQWLRKLIEQCKPATSGALPKARDGKVSACIIRRFTNSFMATNNKAGSSTNWSVNLIGMFDDDDDDDDGDGGVGKATKPVADEPG